MMKNTISALRNFYMGLYYPLLVALLILVGHSTGLDILFGGLAILSMVAGCFICTDFRFAIPVFLYTFFIVTVEHSPNVPYFSGFYLQTHILIILAVLVASIIVGVTCFAIRNRAQAQKPVKGGVWLGMVIFCIALACNGFFHDRYQIKNLFFAFAFFFSLLVVYFLFSTFVRFDRDAFRYFMWSLVLGGMLISLQLVYAYFTTVQFDAAGNIVKESVLIGWGIWTAIGGMLVFLMPACFYFAATERKGWIGYGLGLFEFFAIFLSQSRGALLIGGVILLLCLLVLCFFGEYKKRNRLLTLGLVGLGAIGALVLWRPILALLQNFLNYGFGDNGRFEKWQKGIQNFLRRPIFGTGFYDSYVDKDWKKGVYPYFYHNTLIQFLGAGGVVGFAAYLYHRFTTVCLVLKQPNLYKTFLGICILGLLLFSLLDVLFFNTYPTIMYSLMLVFMDHANLRDSQS